MPAVAQIAEHDADAAHRAPVLEALPATFRPIAGSPSRRVGGNLRSAARTRIGNFGAFCLAVLCPAAFLAPRHPARPVVQIVEAGDLQFDYFLVCHWRHSAASACGSRRDRISSAILVSGQPQTVSGICVGGGKMPSRRQRQIVDGSTDNSSASLSGRMILSGLSRWVSRPSASRGGGGAALALFARGRCRRAGLDCLDLDFTSRSPVCAGSTLTTKAEVVRRG